MPNINFSKFSFNQSFIRDRKKTKYVLISLFFIITLINIFEWYFVFSFNFIFTGLFYAGFFTAIFFIEKYKEQIEEKARIRIFYILFLLFLTLTNISGGVISPLKWSIYILLFYVIMYNLYIQSGIMLFIFFLASIKDFSKFEQYDLFSFLSIFVLLIILFFSGRKTENNKRDLIFNIDTEKEIKDFNYIILGLLEKIVNVYRGFLKSESLLFFFRRPETDEFSLMVFSSSMPENIIQNYQFKLKDDIIGTALNKREFFVVDAASIKIPYYNSNVYIKNIVTLPLLSGKIIGAIVCDYKVLIENSEGVKRLLHNLSSEILNVLNLFEINRKVMEREKRVSILYDIYGKLNFLESKHNIIEKFFEEVKKFDIYSGYLAEYSSDDKCYFISEIYNYQDAVKNTRFLPSENELLRYIHNTGNYLILNNVSEKNIDLNFKRKNIDKFLISLLKSRTGPLGFIKLDKEKNYNFSDFEIKTIQMLLSKVAVLLENVKLYEKVKRQATEDGLTGLYNHATFQEKLLQTLEKKDRAELNSVSLALLDIDFFKKFNDSFGHQEGDRVLKKIANMLLKFSQENTATWAARYGGEEFVFVMENYDIVSATKLMEQIRKFSEENLKGGDDKEQRQITLSIGVATYPHYASNARELIKIADDALYLAKQEGRNRVKNAVDLMKRKMQ